MNYIIYMIKGGLSLYQFEFNNPVRVFFGKDELCHLPTVIKHYGGKVLVLYSDSFRRNSNYYDEIINILNSEDVETIECCGIMANPRAYVVDRIAQLCRKSKIKLLLAMGGGSVMDCAKAVSAIACTEETCADLLNREVRIENVLPVVTIPTTLSTGSEMNCGGLISIPEKKAKISFGHSLLYPKASFIVPEFTYTQDIKYTLAGCADIIFHIMENTYFTRGTKMQMNIEVMECLMRNVIRYSLVLKKSPMDYEARANLCWIASWALNGFLENGTGRTPICHAIEHEVSGYYDIPHSFGMAVIVPKWLRHIICNETIDAICRFGSEVFGLDISVDSNGALATVKHLETYLYEQMELQKTFSCFSNDIETTISEMAYHICGKCELTGIKNIRSHDIISILRECCMKTREG